MLYLAYIMTSALTGDRRKTFLPMHRIRVQENTPRKVINTTNDRKRRTDFGTMKLVISSLSCNTPFKIIAIKATASCEIHRKLAASASRLINSRSHPFDFRARSNSVWRSAQRIRGNKNTSCSG